MNLIIGRQHFRQTKLFMNNTPTIGSTDEVTSDPSHSPVHAPDNEDEDHLAIVGLMFTYNSVSNRQPHFSIEKKARKQDDLVEDEFLDHANTGKIQTEPTHPLNAGKDIVTDIDCLD